MRTRGIHDHLPHFNSQGTEYRILIGDRGRPETQPVRRINDINRGSVENAIEYSNRFQARAVCETNLKDATGVFLEIWAEVLGFERQPAQSDAEFVGYMIGKILSSVAAHPTITAILPRPTFKLVRARQTGFVAGYSAAGVGPIDPDSRERVASAIVTHKSNAYYAFAEGTLDVYDQTIRVQIKTAIAAGIDVFAGNY